MSSPTPTPPYHEERIQRLETTAGLPPYQPPTDPPPDPDPEPPNTTPQNLTATAVAADPNKVQLNWDVVEGALNYKLYSNSSYDPPTQVNSLGTITTNSSTRGPLPTGIHTYWVTAVVDGIESDGSDAASIETPTSSSPPPEPPSGAPVGQTTIWAHSFENGLSGWDALQTMGVHRSNPTTPPAGHSFQIVNDGAGHTTAGRFELRESDNVRSELITSDAANDEVVPGNTIWISWDMKLDASFPTPNRQWTILYQTHAGTGSPPVCIELDSSNRLVLRNNALNLTPLVIGPADKGQWHRYDMQVRYANDNTGFVRMFRDGVEVVPATSRRTMNSSSGYHKFGIYRQDTSNDGTMITFIDNVRFSK